jgi:hypothetical protein
MYKIADVEIDEGQALCCLRPESLAIHVGDACVVQCERVQEYGRVTRLAELDGNPPSERHYRIRPRRKIMHCAAEWLWTRLPRVSRSTSWRCG